MVLRSEAGPIIGLSAWLDGAIAVFGVTAITTAFAINSFSGAAGVPASFVANVAYPIGDVALLALAVALIVMVPFHPAGVSYSLPQVVGSWRWQTSSISLSPSQVRTELALFSI